MAGEALKIAPKRREDARERRVPRVLALVVGKPDTAPLEGEIVVVRV